MDKPTPPKTITTRTLGTGPAVEFVFLTDAIAHGEAMAAWGAAQERERIKTLTKAQPRKRDSYTGPYAGFAESITLPEQSEPEQGD